MGRDVRGRTLLSSSHAITDPFFTGKVIGSTADYLINFDRDLTGCAAIVTPKILGGVVNGRSGAARDDLIATDNTVNSAIDVHIVNGAGTPTASAFSLAVFCR
jgi:hypothetical protein